MMLKFSQSITQRRGRVGGHVRSVSLPCLSHPLITNLDEKIADVQLWLATSGDASIALIEAGLSHIKHLVVALNDFLTLSDTKAVLQASASSTECLLENLLRLVDSYGSLLSDLVELKQHQFEVQSALRRNDSALFTASLKSQKRIEKDLKHLMVSLRVAMKSISFIHASDAPEGDVIEHLKVTFGAISAASVVLFNRVVAMSAAASTAATSSALCTVRSFRKKICNAQKEMQIHVKFEELEKCVKIVESGSEKVLRQLVNCRVTLLNIESNSL